MFGNLTSGRLPSLNALRAFEVMGRTGRATAAAEELNVTHSAVSLQVKALEATLGVRLFTGPKHRLELTPAGRELLAGLSEGFDRITAAVTQVRSGEGELHVAVNASLSVKWLIPRLSGFSADHPEIRLQIEELAPHATSHRGAHGVLRIVPTGRLGDPLATFVMQNHTGPVLTPELGRRFPDPLTAPRLAAQTHPIGWTLWAEIAGVELPPAPERPFPHLHFALDAALAGLGAAVLPWPLVAEDVLTGRLEAPFGFRRMESAFALLQAPGADSRALRRFRDWLVAEGLKTPEPPPAP